MLANFSNYFELMFIISIMLEWVVFFIYCNKNFTYKINKSYVNIINILLIILATQINKGHNKIIEYGIISGIISNIIYMNIVYNIRLISSIKASVLYVVYLVILYVVSGYIVLNINNIESIYHMIESELYIFEVIIVSKILLIAILLCRKYIDKKSRLNVLLVFVTILVNLCCLIFITVYIYDDNDKLSKLGIENLIFVIMYLILSSSILIIFILAILKLYDKKVKDKLIDNNIDVNYKSYETLEENYDRIRHLYHDLKHHIICIKNYNTKDEIIDYINVLNTEIEEFESFIETGNHTLDTILNHKVYISNKYNIKLNSYINIKNIDFMENADICTIFSNALDNAIEACKNMPEGIDRKIDVKLTYVNEFCIIKFTNTKSNDIKLHKNMILTTKSDIFNNGIGIKSMQRVINKYNGELLINYSDDEFVLKIMLPIKSSECID